MKFAVLPESFFEPSAEIVAPLLLGQWLIRQTPRGLCGGPIVETEAYICNDAACHAARGETPRNRVMWGKPGRSYVYLIYGFHFCFNAVCQPAGIAEAVLVRAIEPIFGEDLMREKRPVTNVLDLTNGPGKLCAAMAIDRTLDGANLCEANSALYIARNPMLELFRKERGPIVTTTRIGISKAAEMPLRFYLEGSPFISKRMAGSKLKLRSKIKINR
ncbi:MAG: DNA-3-methyladenine glycosylase [Limisphaerales bacterium]